MTNWIADSTMSWFIPIGWHRKLSEGRDWFGVYEADYESCGDRGSRALLIGGRIDAYKLIRHIDAEGTYRTDKFHHWTSRSRSCRVLLDGRVLQEEHP